ncbi:hypothetical protein [Bacillus sp. AFS041924]|uniref:hypothetical protein n=1 Tax=Bacillus sp. AFS041924 TaxID=2033503 RepID=UPI00159BCD78|nr:hypothetical protein [Bacillus sp. AFS041924]
MIWIAGGIVAIIAFGFFMEKKFGTGALNKSDNQTMNEEIGRYTTNHINTDNTPRQ